MSTPSQPPTAEHETDEAPREAALIAALADIVERTCVVERPATVVQSPTPQKTAKAA